MDTSKIGTFQPTSAYIRGTACSKGRESGNNTALSASLTIYSATSSSFIKPARPLLEAKVIDRLITNRRVALVLETMDADALADFLFSLSLVANKHNSSYGLMRRDDWRARFVYSLPNLVICVAKFSGSDLD
jgi:hypothetical protein